MSFLLKNWAKLYLHPTPCEVLLEPHIAAHGKPYRAQHLIPQTGSILDFAWHLDRVAIEVDDPGHLRPERVQKDAERTAKLAKLGWVVVRVTNDEVRSNPSRAFGLILERLQQEREKQEHGFDACIGIGSGPSSRRGGSPQGDCAADEDKEGRCSPRKAGGRRGTRKGAAPGRRKGTGC